MKRLALVTGIVLLAAIWAGPLLDAWRDSFAAHMLAHMGVVAIAAPLIAVGVVGVPSLVRKRFTPSGPSGHLPHRGGGDRQTWRPLPPLDGEGPTEGRGWGDRSAMRDEIASLSLPLIASLFELVVVWGWHAPTLRALAESSAIATVLEQGSFLAAGLFLWLVCIGGGTDGSARSAAGAFALLLTSVHMTLLGALLALSPRPLYGAGEVTCFGLTLDAGQDQELGGVIMLLVGAAVYLAGGVALLGRVLAADPKKAAG